MMKRFLDAMSPHLFPFTQFFPPKSIKFNRVEFKYTPTAITASDMKLEKIKSLCLNGNYGQEVYESIIKPRISELVKA
jgi:hypothetical protein